MPPSLDPRAERVLSFWIGAIGPHGLADDEHRRRCFAHDETFDALVRGEFLGDLEALVRGEREAWLETPRGRVAYVIVLDQFSRNIHRGTSQAFAADASARRLARQAIARGLDHSMTARERMFLYLPFEHSEDAADQALSVSLITQLGNEYWTRYALAHESIIIRFGRFPHRNAVLGRTSTPEELALLNEPMGSF